MEKFNEEKAEFIHRPATANEVFNKEVITDENPN